MEAILLSIGKQFASRTQSYRSDSLCSTSWGIGLIMLAICTVILPYRHASSHPAPSMAPVYVPSAEAVTLRALPMPPPQEAQFYYPDLSKTGFSKALSPNTTLSHSTTEVKLAMYDLVTDGNTVYQFNQIPELKDAYSIIVFFSSAGDLYKTKSDVLQSNISKMSYTVLPLGTTNLPKYGIKGAANNTYKIILTSTSYSDLAGSDNGMKPVIYDAGNYKWEMTTNDDLEVFNIQWATVVDNSAGSMGVVCSDDFLRDTLEDRQQVYESTSLVRRYPLFVNEKIVYDNTYQLVVDSSTNEPSLHIRGFGTIALSDIGIKAEEIDNYGVAMLPPHRHDAAEIYAGYEDQTKIFMRLDENVIELDKGSYAWIPNNVLHGYVTLFDRRIITEHTPPTQPKQNCFPYLFPQGQFTGIEYYFFPDLSRMPEPKFFYQVEP